MDYPAYQVGRYGSLPPSTKVLHGWVFSGMNYETVNAKMRW